jgi:hypothetical protein
MIERRGSRGGARVLGMQDAVHDREELLDRPSRIEPSSATINPS